MSKIQSPTLEEIQAAISAKEQRVAAARRQVITQASFLNVTEDYETFTKTLDDYTLAAQQLTTAKAYARSLQVRKPWYVRIFKK